MKHPLSTLVAAVLAFSAIASAQPISSFRLAPAEHTIFGRKLWATVDGKERQLTTKAISAWRVEDGRVLLWSAPDGSGGYENEGQSLWRYDAASGKQRKIMSEYFLVHTVRPVESKSGETMYIVTMFDGGLGAPHLAVVDPKRGEVWRHTVARLAAIRNGKIAVAVLESQEIAETDPARIAKIPAKKMIYLDLDALRKRPVIHLTPTNR